ncbi:hypothetical protein V2J09_011385 [Rumex salicifolius]
MKDLGELKNFFGLEVERSSKGLFVCQRRYAEDLLKKYGMQNCKSIDSPIEKKEMSWKILDFINNWWGSLIYLTITRPDLAYAVGVISQFMQKPRKPHVEVIRRIVRYVRQTVEYGILYEAKVQPEIVGFTDADWAGDPSTRRSTNGYTFSLGSGVVSWCSKNQSTVALSTKKTEYRAATMVAQECTWLLRLVQDLGQDTDYTVGIYCDNQSAIKLTTNLVFHVRTKHIEVHHHYIREKVLSGEVELLSIATNDQIADIFTKALAIPKFGKFRSILETCTRESAMKGMLTTFTD